MNFRVVATQPRRAESGTLYNHTVWMGEFNSLEVDEDEACELARERTGYECQIAIEAIPTIFH